MKILEPLGTFCTKYLFGFHFTVYVVVSKINCFSSMYTGYGE